MQASTINMAQALLDRGRGLWEQDRYDEANRVLSRLLSLRAIPADVAERAQFYLGDIQLAQGHYSKARRHLAAAIGSGVGVGETHFLMACALEWDDESDAQAAYTHYRKAVQLDPGQPLYSSAYALMRIKRRPHRAKFDREALTRLRSAFAASPDDVDIVYNYALGLLEMKRLGEAQMVLRRARKRWPEHPAFEGLWFDFLAEHGSVPRPEAAPELKLKVRVASKGGPVILKFPVRDVASTARPAPGRRSGVKSVLASFDAAAVREISHNLKLTERADIDMMRSDIARSLRDRDQLREVCSRLSSAGQDLLQLLAKAGGCAERRQLILRLDGPSRARGPHWARKQPPTSPIDELRRHGLVFIASASRERPDSETVIIPSDLRRLLREIVQG
jgi:tetratricopeptide (TPR) repeat protein